MKKVCTKCKEEKDTSLFGKDSSRKDNLKFWCKACCRTAGKKWHYNNHTYVKKYERIRANKAYHQMKDGLYHVYILPEEHYCGQTDNPNWRKNQHTSNGKITNGFEVIMSFKTRQQALDLESSFHKMGWLGAK